MKKQFAVIGLGRFGGNLVQELADLDVEVLAIDINHDVVQKFIDIATHAVQANAMDESVLKSLGLRNFDHVIVSFGDNIEASILTTLLLKELGVKEVWVKASNSYHQKYWIGSGRIRSFIRNGTWQEGLPTISRLKRSSIISSFRKSTAS